MSLNHQLIDFILKKNNVNINQLHQKLDELLKSYSKVQGGDAHFSNTSIKLLNEAQIQAQKMKDEFVSLEHLLLAFGSISDKTSQLL